MTARRRYGHPCLLSIVEVNIASILVFGVIPGWI